MTEQDPHPNLHKAEDYIQKVSETILAGVGTAEDVHFEYLTEALEALGVTKDPYKGVTAESFSDESREIIATGFEQLSKCEPDGDTKEKIQKLWDYLAEEDPLEPSDLIFVFGGISESAVLEAIRLKNENYAPKILFSGKHASYAKDSTQVSEAEKYAELAIKNGVDKNDILLEKDSINTPENVINSAKLLKKLGTPPKQVIAVSLPYHMKRGALTLKAGFDWDFTLVRHPGKSAKYTRDTFYKIENGWSYVCYEYLKLNMARKMGHF